MRTGGRWSANSRRRRAIDRAIAAAIAVTVVGVGFAVYERSDIRATHLAAGTLQRIPEPSITVPARLAQKWSTSTDPVYGAVTSPYGVVITADAHTVTAHDATTGAVRWSYSRSDSDLCAIGSGDLDTVTFDPGKGFGTGEADGRVRGLLSVFAENGFCSQINTFDPDTGSRSYARTSPTGPGGQLTFGGTYAAWLDPDLVEIWRFDLVRTAQYGDLPNPTTAFQAHLGCRFTDLAVADLEYGTVEHCVTQGPHARVALQFTDPYAVNHKWGPFTLHHRMDVDTGSDAARIVGITADRVAVLVASPAPAVVLYDAAGTVISRTPVDIPAVEIVAADGSGRITPAVADDSARRSLIGTHLLSVSTDPILTAAPSTSIPTTPSAAAAPTDAAGPMDTAAPTDAAGPTADAGPPPEVSVQTLTVDWVAANALGLPAQVGGSLLMPVEGGLQVLDSAAGPSVGDGAPPPRVLAVNRQGYRGRVDAAAVGTMVIENRGPAVVALQ